MYAATSLILGFRELCGVEKVLVIVAPTTPATVASLPVGTVCPDDKIMRLSPCSLPSPYSVLEYIFLALPDIEALRHINGDLSRLVFVLHKGMFDR